MTRHTDIVGKPWRKSSGIHDRRTCGLGGRPLAHLDNVSGAGTVTIFAADRQFIEWRSAKRSGDLRHRVRPAAVADDARSIDRPAHIPETTPRRAFWRSTSAGPRRSGRLARQARPFRWRPLR